MPDKRAGFGTPLNRTELLERLARTFKSVRRITLPEIEARPRGSKLAYCVIDRHAVIIDGGSLSGLLEAILLRPSPFAL